jgi:hypothetical protein
MTYFCCLRPSTFGLALLVAILSPAFGLSDRSQDQEDAARRMDKFISSRDFSGVVLVARNGHVLFQKAYGTRTVSTTCRTNSKLSFAWDQ